MDVCPILSFWRKAGVEIELSREGGSMSPPPATQNRGFVSQEGGGQSPPLRHKMVVLCRRRGGDMSAVSHGRMSVLCDAADMSAV